MKTLDWNSSDFYIAAEENERTRKLSRFLETQPSLQGHVLLASSGTSSTSLSSTKWVALSKNAILASAEAVNKHLHLSKADILFQPISTFHIGGLALHARGYLAGAPVIDWRKDNSKWDTEKFYQALSESKATVVSMVPTQVFDLIQKGFPSPESLRAVVVGGAALSQEIFYGAKKLGWPLLPSLGMTEVASQIATANLESLKKNEYPDLYLMPHVEARTSFQKNLDIKSPALFSGYVFQKADGECEFYNPIIDGWFTTSDFVEIRGKTVTHLGRASDFIKISGELVSTVNLENEFAKLLYGNKNLKSLNSMTLAFIPDARLGSSVTLFVEEDVQDATFIKELVEGFNSRVRAFEKIRAVKIVKQLPKTELGKIIKPQLASLNAKSLSDF